MKVQALAKGSKLVEWCAIIRISLLLTLLQLPNTLSDAEDVDLSTAISANSTYNTEQSQCTSRKPTLKDILLNRSRCDCGNMTSANDSAIESKACLVRPRCDEINGCNAPLHCFDFQQLGNASIIRDPPQTVRVTPHQLESIVEDAAMQNVCAIVLFYAPWCAFSVQFARKFNALGRSFDRLPILAVDLAENDPYKYILAYLPMVAFYYKGKMLFKFSLDFPFEDLQAIVSNVTGFEPLEGVALDDVESEGPVPTRRDTSDQAFLILCVWWVVFIGLVYAMKSQWFRNFCLGCLRTTCI